MSIYLFIFGKAVLGNGLSVPGTPSEVCMDKSQGAAVQKERNALCA